MKYSYLLVLLISTSVFAEGIRCTVKQESRGIVEERDVIKKECIVGDINFKKDGLDIDSSDPLFSSECGLFMGAFRGIDGEFQVYLSQVEPGLKIEVAVESIILNSTEFSIFSQTLPKKFSLKLTDAAKNISDTKNWVEYVGECISNP